MKFNVGFAVVTVELVKSAPSIRERMPAWVGKLQIAAIIVAPIVGAVVGLVA